MLFIILLLTSSTACHLPDVRLVDKQVHRDISPPAFDRIRYQDPVCLSAAYSRNRKSSSAGRRLAIVRNNSCIPGHRNGAPTDQSAATQPWRLVTNQKDRVSRYVPDTAKQNRQSGEYR